MKNYFRVSAMGECWGNTGLQTDHAELKVMMLNLENVFLCYTGIVRLNTA
jgi:hypothetical protein